MSPYVNEVRVARRHLKIEIDSVPGCTFTVAINLAKLLTILNMFLYLQNGDVFVVKVL